MEDPPVDLGEHVVALLAISVAVVYSHLPHGAAKPTTASAKSIRRSAMFLAHSAGFQANSMFNYGACLYFYQDYRLDSYPGAKGLKCSGSDAQGRTLLAKVGNHRKRRNQTRPWIL